jgi:hypothetical protein
LHVLKGDIAQDTGIVDKNIDATKVLDSGVDNCLSVLHAVVVCDGLSAGLADFFDDKIGGLHDHQYFNFV